MENYKNIWLFLPCLNEEGNVVLIVEAILNLRIEHLHILLVIDTSTDRTEELADALHEQYPQMVFVLHRTPPGSRALAGKDAFLSCLQRGADVIIEMDADFSHDPSYIPRMLQELSDPQVDVVLGSRFLPGGSDADRSPFRTCVSRISGVIFRCILGISLTDMGSGFKAYKRDALESIEPQSLFSKKGLAISMESIFRVLKNGNHVKEIPIIFKDRKRGVSKLSWKDFFEPIFISVKLVHALGRFHEKR
jgi:dolichol-phosphate mannosyltransferase